MQRVPLAHPVKDLLTDGGRYIVWGRLQSSRVTVFDALTEQRRTLKLPAACRQNQGSIGTAAAGLLLLYCREGMEYGVDLRSGRARRFGEGFPHYENAAVGKRWVVGRSSPDDPGGFSVFENRRTGLQVTKQSGRWDLDHDDLRPARRVCGNPQSRWLHSEWLSGDLYRVVTPSKNRWRLRVRRCGEPARTLEGTDTNVVYVSKDVVMWSTVCPGAYFGEQDRPGCRPMVKTETFTSRHRTEWRLPDGSFMTSIDLVARAGRWIFAARTDGGGSPDDSAGTSNVFALYRARIPQP